jgi:hypothetical protein
VPCILEIACVVFGIIVLVKGRVSLSAKKEVRGGPAYLVGIILISVLPLAIGFGIVMGIRQAQQGAQPGIDWTGVAIEMGLIIGCAVTAFVVALATAKPKKKKKRRRRIPEKEDYDYYDRERDDDGPRRRRYEDDELDDEEDDRPRRRRRDEYDDEDDRPRRRHDDLDDRAR